MRRFWVTLLLLGVLGLAGCGKASETNPAAGSSEYGGPYGDGPTAAPTLTATGSERSGYGPVLTQTPTVVVSPSPTTVEVRIVNFGFEPAELTVAAGTTVIWRNDSPTTHTVTAKNGAFDSGLLEAGQTFSFMFREPGTYEYWCTLHPEMLGRVIVR
ncbi:MAG: cupredoxin family copper-binding protein [Thermomicrobium sp.]